MAASVVCVQKMVDIQVFRGSYTSNIPRTNENTSDERKKRKNDSINNH